MGEIVAGYASSHAFTFIPPSRWKASGQRTGRVTHYVTVRHHLTLQGDTKNHSKPPRHVTRKLRTDYNDYETASDVTDWIA